MLASRSTSLRVAAISFVFLVGACSASVDSTPENPGAHPAATGGDGIPTAALVAACTEYHAAHRDWFQRCEGHDLDQATVDSLIQSCAYHAALPGMTVSVNQLT